MNEQETNCSGGFEIKGNIEEKGNKENSTFSRRVFEQLIPCGEKPRKLLLCNQSRTVEPVRSFSSFQNGRPFSVKALNAGRRMDVGTGPKGCLL